MLVRILQVQYTNLLWIQSTPMIETVPIGPLLQDVLYSDATSLVQDWDGSNLDMNLLLATLTRGVIYLDISVESDSEIPLLRGSVESDHKQFCPVSSHLRPPMTNLCPLISNHTFATSAFSQLASNCSLSIEPYTPYKCSLSLFSHRHQTGDTLRPGLRLRTIQIIMKPFMKMNKKYHQLIGLYTDDMKYNYLSAKKKKKKSSFVLSPFLKKKKKKKKKKK